MVRLDHQKHPRPRRRSGGMTPRQAAAVAGLIDAVAGLDAGQRRRLDHHLQEEARAEENSDYRCRTTEGREGQRVDPLRPQ